MLSSVTLLGKPKLQLKVSPRVQLFLSGNRLQIMLVALSGSIEAA